MGNSRKSGGGIPSGIEVSYAAGWVVTSEDYRRRTRYRSVKYANVTRGEAIRRFVEAFGTEGQRREFARAAAAS